MNNTIEPDELTLRAIRTELCKQFLDMKSEITMIPRNRPEFLRKARTTLALISEKIMRVSEVAESAPDAGLSEDDKEELTLYRRILGDNICDWVEKRDNGTLRQACDEATAVKKQFDEKRDLEKQAMQALKSWLDSESKIQHGARAK